MSSAAIAQKIEGVDPKIFWQITACIQMDIPEPRT